MASILKVDALQGVTAAGSILVTGEGNSTTTNLQQGLAKAWLNMFGDDVTVRDSINISTTADTATGKKVVNISNAFVNDDYAPATSVGENTTSAGNRASSTTPLSTTSFQFFTTSTSAGGYSDCDFMTGSVHGDLA